ncbi:CDP-glycerol glycerophosphotransferase family protein [Clostridium polynesiense]|uniref:CDP-glycerol glycerophosphotransferase family protein n=1 Tax=Clostridium polynesiense TaxID=1325933 RepID=UPI00058C2764|nr:CDP-glycerol glycerophosphotransferase family protein [Clostridium polynesiense]
MEEKALSQNNIILDLESDSYKAIKVSHGLISGYSSIMFQYMLTGKPVLSIIDKERKNKKRLYCTDYLGNYSYNEDMNINEFKEMILMDKDPKKRRAYEKIFTKHN